jgi:hypothetical protein
VSLTHIPSRQTADGSEKEGVDLDRLNQLVRKYGHGKSIPGTGAVDPVLPYQTLTNTNTWRAIGDERDAPGKCTFFATERFDVE